MKKTSDNGYFIISPNHEHVLVEKAHFCTWNLPDGLEFLEVGMLIQLKEDFISLIEASHCAPELEFKVFIPWYDGGKSFGDLFSTLKNPDNIRFVFNEPLPLTKYISDGGPAPQGVVFSFHNQEKFCVLPIGLDTDKTNRQMVSAKVVFPRNGKDCLDIGNRIYFRFFVKADERSIPWKHGGVAKQTFCYDIKVNEPRNAPSDFPLEQRVEIHACYCLHIVPATFENTLQDHAAFKSIRTLEATESTAYLKGVPEIATTIKSGNCFVVFNKLKNDKDLKKPFSFFTVFTKERIGPSQLALAIGANIVCGLFPGRGKVAAFVVFLLVMAIAWVRSGRRHH